jgi:hypothetical protein
MNKQSIIGLILFSCMLANCKKETIKLYDSGHYVQFTGSVLDTISLSFFFYPNQSQVDVALPVKMIGKMTAQDVHYKISTVSEGTTASADHYVLAPDYVFKKGQATDTAHVIIKNGADLATKTYIISLRIAADGDVQPGQTAYTTRVFKINDMISKPIWWNADMDRIYLGLYTDKKFRTFISVVGIGDISAYSPSEQRGFMLQFKYYLIAMKDAGTPVLEADGTDMLSTVPLIG